MYKDHLINKIDTVNSSEVKFFYLLLERDDRRGYEVYGFHLDDAKTVKREIKEDFSSDLKSFNEPLCIVGYCEDGGEFVMFGDIFGHEQENGVETNE